MGLVSWPAGGAYAPTVGVYPSTGGLYPVIGSGFVACWGCKCGHCECIAVYRWSISGHWVRFRGLLRGHRCTLGGVYPVHGDLVSCSVGVCMCRPGLYIRSSGLVSCSVGLHMLPLGVYIRSLGLVSWSVEDVFLWLVGVPMAIESLSGSWSAQVPERPAAVGSRLAYPRGCRGVDRGGASRDNYGCRRIG